MSFDPMLVFLKTEMMEFQASGKDSAIVARCYDLVTRCDLPAYYTWLLAANFLREENARLRSELAAASNSAR